MDPASPAHPGPAHDSIGPIVIHARVADEADLIAILAKLVGIAMALTDCEMVAYIANAAKPSAEAS